MCTSFCKSEPGMPSKWTHRVEYHLRRNPHPPMAWTRKKPWLKFFILGSPSARCLFFWEEIALQTSLFLSALKVFSRMTLGPRPERGNSSQDRRTHPESMGVSCRSCSWAQFHILSFCGLHSKDHLACLLPPTQSH